MKSPRPSNERPRFSRRDFLLAAGGTTASALTVKYALGESRPQSNATIPLQLDQLGIEYRLGDSGEVKIVYAPSTSTDNSLLRLPKVATATTFYAAFTDLGDRGLMCLEKLPNLREILFFETKVKGPGLQHLAALDTLSSLSVVLGSAGIDRGACHIYDCRGLLHLEIRQTPLSDSGLNGLRKLNRLTYLSLDDTKVADRVAAELVELKDLEFLGLAGTGVSNQTVTEVAGLPKLEDLDLRWTRVTNECLAALSRLDNLKLLEFGPLVLDGCLKELAQFKALTHLFLEGCTLTQEDVADLCKLHRLNALSMDNCSAPAGSVEMLQAAMPRATEDLVL